MEEKRGHQRTVGEIKQGRVTVNETKERLSEKAREILKDLTAMLSIF